MLSCLIKTFQSYGRTNLAVSLSTIGATNVTVGNAIQNAKIHAFSHTDIIVSIMPTLKIEITNDIKPDINNAIKKQIQWLDT